LDLNVIIVAGGQGKRMQSETPKQFLTISNKPILLHTIEKFYHFSNETNIIVVLPKPFIEFWKSICKKYDCKIKHTIVEGGDARFFSVKNGLDHVSKNGIVAVHDGVRPLVSALTIKNVIEKTIESGNAIPVVKINESIRRLEFDNSYPVNRKDYMLVQTPQCFRTELLKKAYEQDFSETFTDDASVVEALGEKINLVDGNFENIKITRPVDLKFAKAYLK
jgi:2-C-methyl-D-erythritol 4-phosphate cytidylyltransferase